VPEGDAGQGHGGDAGVSRAQAVLGVIPLDERGQRQADGADRLHGDEAHPPAVVVRVEPHVELG